MPSDEGIDVYYTTAPEDYDYGYVISTRTHGYSDERGRPYRQVLIPAEFATYQGSRYLSGLYPVWTPEEFAEQIDAGYVRHPVLDWQPE